MVDINYKNSETKNKNEKTVRAALAQNSKHVI
jgi:hypothetical protein